MTSPQFPKTAAEPLPAPKAERPLGFLVKQGAIYSAAPILQRVISIGMTRLYTEWLGRAGLGVKETVDLWAIALQQVLGFNMLGSMVRFYYDQQSDEDRNAVVTTCMLVVTLLAVVACGALLLVAPGLTPLLLGRGGQVSEGELVSICTLMLVLVPFQLATMSGLYYLQTLRRPALYTAIQTAKFALEVSLNFYFIGARGLGVWGWLVSMLIGEVVTATALCGWILWRLRPRIVGRILRPILAYSAPMVPVGVLQLFLHSLDRRFVLAQSQEMAGVYGLGYKVAYLIVILLLGPFVLTWQPWIFGLESAKERARMVARVGTYGVLSIAVASLAVILGGRQAVQILAKDRSFWEAYRVVPFVATGYVFWALYHVSQMPLFLDKRTGPLLTINALAVLLNATLNATLIPRYGIVGAAVATVTTFAVLAGMGMWAGRRAAGVSFELGRLGGILAAVSAGGAGALWVDWLEKSGRWSVVAALSVKAALFVVLVGALWTLVLHADERSRFTAWVARRARG